MGTLLRKPGGIERSVPLVKMWNQARTGGSEDLRIRTALSAWSKSNRGERMRDAIEHRSTRSSGIFLKITKQSPFLDTWGSGT
jgi:hypothetical protein